MIFEKVTNENKEIFHRTYITALRQGFVGFVPENFIAKLDNEFDSFMQEMIQDNMQMYICYQESMPIGVVVFGEYKESLEKDALLDSIYFLKEYHSKGYVTEALDFAEQILKQEGYKKVCLWCSKENERAWRFYTKHNYMPTNKEWNDELDGKIFHNILFEKELKN